MLHVNTSQNNALVTLTDMKWNKVLGGGTGLYGFKWAKQNTPYACEVTTKEVLNEAMKYWLQRISIVFKGTWLWREGVFKAMNDVSDIQIQYIADKTPLQHGGCRWVRPKRN